MSSPDKKIVLVTGGGSGIGRASAFAFAKTGALVVIVDRSEKEGLLTEKKIVENGGEARFFQADVSKEAEVSSVISEIITSYGTLTAAHNNAGIAGARKPLISLEEKEWDRVLDINLKGVWLCLKHEIRAMMNLGIKGSIVNTASTWAFVGAPTAGAYVASKHGVLGLTRTAALEYASQGIRVNAVCPGATRTHLLRLETNPEKEQRLVQAHPLGRIASPDEIAAAAVWLCSDAASFVTGQCLTVDGGFLAQ